MPLAIESSTSFFIAVVYLLLYVVSELNLSKLRSNILSNDCGIPFSFIFRSFSCAIAPSSPASALAVINLIASFVLAASSVCLPIVLIDPPNTIPNAKPPAPPNAVSTASLFTSYSPRSPFC